MSEDKEQKEGQGLPVRAEPITGRNGDTPVDPENRPVPPTGGIISHLSGKRRYVMAAALIAVSVLISYMNSIHGTWAMDDLVVNKPVGIADILETAKTRKVTYFSFLLNSLIAPISPANFRIVNIGIHIINSLLVFMLAFRAVNTILARRRPASGEQHSTSEQVEADEPAFFAALLSGLIFALHPININAVAYIVQRMASLSTLFVLISLHAYISATRSVKKPKTAVLYLLSGISLVSSILAKENAVMAVPLVMLYHYIVLPRGNRKYLFRRAAVIVGTGTVIAGLAYHMLGLNYALTQLTNLGANLNEPMTRTGWMAADVYWTPAQHVLSGFRVVSRYIFLIVCPLPRFLVFDWWGFPVSETITEPVTTLLSIFLLCALVLAALFGIKRLPLLSFGILWYLIAISLETFIALGSDLYFEHRNYLPMSGLVAGIAGQAAVSLRGRIRERTVWSAALILCVILGSLTFSRNFVWKDSFTLWGDTLEKSPANLRAMIAMGNSYLTRSDLDNAETYYSSAVNISSRDRRLHFLNESIYSLGMMFLLQGRLDEAEALIAQFDRTIESYKPRILEGFLKALNNDLDGAMRDYQEILNVTEGVDTVIVLTLMGDAYREKGLTDLAIQYYNQVISLHPEFSAAYYGIAASYLNTGAIDQAAGYLRKTLSIDPNHVLALSDTAEVMLIQGAEAENALLFAERAVSNAPPFFQPYLTMGNILTLLGREEEADIQYANAARRGASEHLVLLSRARSYYMTGDTGKANYYISEIRRLGDVPENIRRVIEAGP